MGSTRKGLVLGLAAMALLAPQAGASHDDFEADGVVYTFLGPQPARLEFSQALSTHCSGSGHVLYEHGYGIPGLAPRHAQVLPVQVSVTGSPDGCIGAAFGSMVPQFRTFRLENAAAGVLLHGIYTIQVVPVGHNFGLAYESWTLDGSVLGQPGAFQGARQWGLPWVQDPGPIVEEPLDAAASLVGSL